MKKETSIVQWLLAAFFLLLLILFIVLCMSNSRFLSWVFERHSNVLSWYIRPLFIIPICYFSYRKNPAAVSFTLLLLFSSMFWFPKPEVVSEEVKAFLQFEQNWLSEKWTLAKSLQALSIPVFLGGLILAFWKRSLRTGVALIAAMAILKTLWSVKSGGDSGYSVIIPALIGLVVCLAAVWWFFKRKK